MRGVFLFIILYMDLSPQLAILALIDGRNRMRVIKPYGRSHAGNDENEVVSGNTENKAGTTSDAKAEQKPRRVLRLAPDFVETRDVPVFAKDQDALVIAQWISVIDKIATKPTGNKKPTKEQRALRDKLGKACWTFICDNKLLEGNLPEGIKADVLWNSKIHPYPKENSKQGETPPKIEGRWFDTFIGTGNGNKFDASAVAKKICDHLYVNAYSINPDRPRKGKGVITHRADSIEKSILKRHRVRQEWTCVDKEIYKKKGDIAGIIYRGIEAEKATSAGKHFGIAMDALRLQYADIFGKNTTIKAAQKDPRKPDGLFALHEAVKSYYKGVLKRHKKREGILRILPENNSKLLDIIQKKQDNRDLNHLIRLGKIIHYQAGMNQTNTADITAAVIYHWPSKAEIESSPYWGSDGQAEIKRNEAFVRTWRHLLSLMQRTATDWADPDGNQDSDILGNTPINAVTGDAFPRDSFDSKLKLLLGSRANTFLPLDPEDLNSRKEVLRMALDGLATLRNGSFHFKGLDTFKESLTKPQQCSDTLNEAIKGLWEYDVNARRARLVKTLQAADVESNLKEWQAEELLTALTKDTTPLLALPRFNRIIERADNTGVKSLPKPVNREIMEKNSALRCQYVCLKLLYERPFREHLDKYTNEIKEEENKKYFIENFNIYIDKAVERATKAAKGMNKGDKTDEELKLIIAKVDQVGRLTKDDKSINDFFFRLSALTASDFGVQQGYESDGEKAKTQANTIEAFKCEILARAFDDWLNESGFNYLNKLSKNTRESDTNGYKLEGLPKVTYAPAPAETWQHSLYFLLHLAPVHEVSKLLHQIRKWQVLAKDKAEQDKTKQDKANDAKSIAEVLDLYLDMHDAKFEGGGKVPSEGNEAPSEGNDQALSNVPEDFRELFENPDDFDRVFGTVTGKPDEDRRIPIRGLREILRFGHMKPLLQIYQAHKIHTDHINKLQSYEEAAKDKKSQISGWQLLRETLHKKWVKSKNSKSPEKDTFDEKDQENYKKSIKRTTEYRHLSAHIYLVNHLRLHWLMMAVLGRLVDYAGLFERDVYFTMLALIHQQELDPQRVFKSSGLTKLEQGQIFAACGRILHERKGFSDTLESKFNLDTATKYRNNFAHFNMLHENKQPHLTQMVNDARSMMAYDRKLKNAVSKSVMDLLVREGLKIEWTMNGQHMLENATMVAKSVDHLGGTKSGGKKITEALHGQQYVSMVKMLFKGGRDAP